MIGVDGVRGGLQRDDIRCVVLASDASERAVAKVVALARGKTVPIVPGPPSEELGRKLGRPPVMAVGVTDRALANGILRMEKHD